MKIALITYHITRSPRSVSLASGLLKESLKKAFPGDHDVKIFDYYMDEKAHIASDMASYSPDVAGFTLCVWNRDAVIRAAGELKADCSGILLAVGGPEATADSSGLESLGLFDRIFSGEGEGPFVRWIGELSDKQASLSWSPETDLDQIPSPYLSGSLRPSLYGGVLWELSRGCPFRCDFCFESRGSGKVRRFSFDRIERELAWFTENGVSQVFVLDPTFNQNRARAKKILELLRDRGAGIQFYVEGRPEFLDAEMAGLLAEAGVVMQMGLQSANPEVLKCINRTIDPEKYRRQVELLNEAGAVFGLDLIYGLPRDSYRGFCRSLDFALSLQPNHLDIFPLAVLPGTKLHDTASTLGLKYKKEPPYEVESSGSFPSRDLNRARELAKACDLFYAKGRAVGWFLPLVQALQMKPSLFLEEFSLFISAEALSEDPDIDEIRGVQWRFVKDKLTSRGKKKIVPVVRDLWTFHHSYSSAAESEKVCVWSEERRLDVSRVYSLAPSVLIKEFTYDVQIYLETGIANFDAFRKEEKPSATTGMFFLSDVGVEVVSIYPQAADLLRGMDGCLSLADLAAGMGISLKKYRSFFESAVQAGVIYPAPKSEKSRNVMKPKAARKKSAPKRR